MKEETKKCPSCDKDISIKAKKCPFCREDLRGWFSKHPILTFLGVLFLAPFLIAGMFGSSSHNQGTASGSPKPAAKTEFNAAVNFTGTQFVINNLEKSDCENARMEINGGTYKLNGYLLESRKTYTVGAAQFTKDDGTRFNPFNTKPQNFNIECRGSNDLQSAFWYGEFN